MDRVYLNRVAGQRRIHIEMDPTEIADLVDDLAWAVPYDHPATDRLVELLLAAHSLFVKDQDDAEENARKSPEDWEAECSRAMAEADIASHPSRI
ncbi:hypothetical protein [Streptomyces sp. NBC_01268]|uniref:hypothetical protein n=1 Tax=Streptomyces sp. NBC_01268 TaxID=2903806 RepID=UPI002E327F8E|nr:hypothetical protein [Streptomyces sp. NBC_01268]